MLFPFYDVDTSSSSVLVRLKKLICTMIRGEITIIIDYTSIELYSTMWKRTFEWTLTLSRTLQYFLLSLKVFCLASTDTHSLLTSDLCATDSSSANPFLLQFVVFHYLKSALTSHLPTPRVLYVWYITQHKTTPPQTLSAPSRLCQIMALANTSCCYYSTMHVWVCVCVVMASCPTFIKHLHKNTTI